MKTGRSRKRKYQETNQRAQSINKSEPYKQMRLYLFLKDFIAHFAKLIWVLLYFCKYKGLKAEF